MKKFLLTSLMAAGSIAVMNAYDLPRPVITQESVGNGTIDLAWTYDNTKEIATYFNVIVYKIHKATDTEKFILAKSDFDYIESAGTMDKHEDHGAIWDVVPDCPGWFAKFPLYMNGALGIDTFNYFVGADNSDIFGGAYFLSPDYDLSNLQDYTLHIKARLAREAASVSGGFSLWTWSTDWWDEKNIDYKAVPGTDFHYDDLDNKSWKDVEEQCVADEYRNRTRVMFYGSGRSAYWIDSFEVAVNMQNGDQVDYASSCHKVDGAPYCNSYTANDHVYTYSIDTSADTPDDYTYAYEIRAIREDHRDYPWNGDYILAISPLSQKHIIGEFAGISNAIATDTESTPEYFNLQGIRIANPSSGSIVIMRQGGKSRKIIIP